MGFAFIKRQEKNLGSTALTEGLIIIFLIHLKLSEWQLQQSEPEWMKLSFISF